MKQVKVKQADNGELRDWLVFDESSQSVFCSNCGQQEPPHSKTNSFTVGTKTVKSEAIKFSKCHKKEESMIQGITAPEKAVCAVLHTNV